MKSIFLFLTFGLVTWTSVGQSYSGLVNESNTWKEIMYGFAPIPQVYKFDGDTTMGEWEYKKLYMAQMDDLNTWYYQGAIRDDLSAQRVYINFGFGEALLYDFSLEAGESVTIYPLGYPEVLTVESTGTTYVGGNLRKTLTFDMEWYTDTWVVGVGSSQGVNTPATNFPDFNPVLTCFYEENNLSYDNPVEETVCSLLLPVEEMFAERFVLFPNPCRDYFYIASLVGQSISNWAIYAADGKCVLVGDGSVGGQMVDVSSLASGVYVVVLFDGKSEIGHVKFKK